MVLSDHQVVHSDLKPENILVEGGESGDVFLLVIKWYFFFFLQITFRGHLMLTTLDEGVLEGCSVDLGEYLCARVVVAKYEQFQA